MIVIGITGGIASGKSTVARMIARRGIAHVDADMLVHELMRNDKKTLAALAEHFPKAVQKNIVDRAALGEIVGRDEKALTTLESLLHPRVRDAEIHAIKRAVALRRKAVLLDIPLLFESGADALCDIVVSVTAPLELRKRRAFARMNMSEAKFDRLVERQLDDATRNDLADIVIPTSMGKGFTRRRVELFLKQLGIA
jgi:dephospho-CoA kinase